MRILYGEVIAAKISTTIVDCNEEFYASDDSFLSVKVFFSYKTSF